MTSTDTSGTVTSTDTSGTVTSTDTTDMELIRHIMTDRVLFNASMPDEDILALDDGTWEPDANCDHLVCELDDEPIAIIRLYRVSNLTVDMHMHLLPKYWGTGVSDKLARSVEKYLTENTMYCKVMIQTPQCCREVLKAATRDGYELEGILTAAIHWRGNIENMVLMSKFLRRENNG